MLERFVDSLERAVDAEEPRAKPAELSPYDSAKHSADVGAALARASAKGKGTRRG